MTNNFRRISILAGVLISTLFSFTAFADKGIGVVNISKTLSSSDSWLFPADACPATVMSKKDAGVIYKEGFCDSKINACLESCKVDDVRSCYNLAITLQNPVHQEYRKYSEALFLKSCQLGSISGCTNRAAGMQKEQGEDALSCAVNTYMKSCEFDDPWSCAMYGYHLALGKGVTKDLNQSLAILNKACANGVDDPACKKANELIRQIEDVLAVK